MKGVTEAAIGSVVLVAVMANVISIYDLRIEPGMSLSDLSCLMYGVNVV